MTADVRAPLPTSREQCLARDAADPLAPLREQFSLPENVFYLDGNSLGALPKSVPGRLEAVIRQEWGEGLVRSWNQAGWVSMPHRVGDKVARLIGAEPGEVVITDATSVNLYKVLSAAMARSASSERPVLLADAGAFPSDLYIADSVARTYGGTLELIDAPLVRARAERGGGDIAVLLMNHVDYRTGELYDLGELTAAAHAAGALAVWDLAHSAGAVPITLRAADADFAIGCGYKYLNGGPGAPAFVWTNPRHANTAHQPLTGWFGHASPFEFSPEYQPSPGVSRFQCGTPPVLSLAGLECGVDTLLAAEPHGGMASLYAKSLALSDLLAARMAALCPELTCRTPLDRRGSHLAYTHPEGAYAITQAAIARGVIGDFRAPNILRLALTPLYTRFVDVWDAAQILAEILRTQQWREPRFAVRHQVT